MDDERSRDLQPATALWQAYDPEHAEYAFGATDPRAALAWQERTRAALADTVGFVGAGPRPEVSPDPVELERVDRGDYTRTRLLLHTAPHTVMPVYLLAPKEAPRPLPVVLAFHGHGYGVKDIVGMWEDGSERSVPSGYHKDFAVALCRRGFLVAAPEISCFGERQTDFASLAARGSPVPTTCAHTAMLAFHLGGSVAGLRVRDGMRLVDYLAGREDCDVARLGAMGISGGGMHTFFSTCLDTRIRACVVSGYYSTFRDSILAMHHCACNFVPGLHRFGEMYDLVGLIAPRPMLVEAASRDPIFPIEAVRASVERARRVYSVWGLPELPRTDYFEGRHEVSGAVAYDFLAEALGAGQPAARRG